MKSVDLYVPSITIYWYTIRVFKSLLKVAKKTEFYINFKLEITATQLVRCYRYDSRLSFLKIVRNKTKD